jgi:hypothetical protein
VQIDPERRVIVSDIDVSGAYRVVIRHGYAERAVDDQLGASVLSALLDYFKSQDKGQNNSDVFAIPTSSKDTTLLTGAFGHRPTFVLGKNELLPSKDHNIALQVVLHIYTFIRRLTEAKYRRLGIPAEQLVQIGAIRRF